MAEAAYKQMISTFIRQTRPQSFRHGKSPRYPQRCLSSVTSIPSSSPIRNDDTSTTQQWQQHRLSSQSDSKEQSRIAALRNDPEPRSFSSFLTDTYSRQHNYLRISVTERCNLRCLYCMPEEGIQLSPPEHNLTTPEIVYLSEVFVKQGVDKIRLTGGEPTVRKDIVSLMQQIGQLRALGLKELCITTNGISLHRKLDSMVESGLTGVNLSLDTLDPFQFTLMTRRNGHDAVMKSINRILEMNKLGANIKLKINCVVMKGLNEREIVPFVELGREKDIEVRFIEYMPFDGNKWSENKMMSYEEMLALIRVKYPDVHRMQDHANDTSKTYKIPGFVGRIGFITSMTHNFCGTCNRLRITSDGNLKVCLFGNDEVSLRDLLRESNSGKPFDTEAMEALRQLESDRREALVGSTGSLGASKHEAQLLNTIGSAVKRKKEKHAGIGDLENMKNRPMILIDEALSARPITLSTPRSTLPFFEPRRRSTMHGLPQHTVPLHLLAHPRHSFAAQQSRHQSTFLGRRTYRSMRLVRYYFPPPVARAYKFEKSEYPKRVRSTRMRRLTAYIRERFVNCRRAFNSYPSKLSDYDPDHGWTKASVEELRAQAEKVPQPAQQPLTHLDKTGAAHMVEITGKAETKRVATAVATLYFSNPKTYHALSSQQVVKGNAIAVARLAAIQAAKKTSDLVPLAHPSLGITAVSVDVDVFEHHERKQVIQNFKGPLSLPVLKLWSGGVTITATVKCEGKTGVEMEAITAATIGAVTMYDMLKAVDKGMVIMGARVIRKEGGKSGGWEWDDSKHELVKIGANNMKDANERSSQSIEPAHETGSNDTSPKQWQPLVSDVDEWNQGLVDEFSMQETSQTAASERQDGEHSTGTSQQTSSSVSRTDLTSAKDKGRLSSHNEVTDQTAAGKEKELHEKSQTANPSPKNTIPTSHLVSHLRGVQKSPYIERVARAHEPNQRELQLNTRDEWVPRTMSPIRREDLSRGFKRADSRDMAEWRRRRYEEGGGSAGGSVIK